MKLQNLLAQSTLRECCYFFFNQNFSTKRTIAIPLQYASRSTQENDVPITVLAIFDFSKESFSTIFTN